MRTQLRSEASSSGNGTVDRLSLNALTLSADLRRQVRAGEVRFDLGTRAIYAHDSSNYRQVPLGVVLPKSKGEVVAAVEVCRKHGAPVLMRGCGTSLSGETANVAVIVDTSKYMREILEVDPDKKIARVQPGVVRDQLSNMTAERYNLFFAPDTSTHAYATLGGMIGNNSCGVHSVMAGRTSDNIEELEVLLYDGTRMRVGATTDEELEKIIAGGGRCGEIYKKLKELRDGYANLIRQRYPDIPRRVAGYNLDELLPEKGFNVARALVGSEGTLVTILEATVRLVHSPPERSLLVLGYPSVYEAGDAVKEVIQHGPIGLEGFDDRLIRDMREHGMHSLDIPMLPEGKGWLLAEFGGETTEESHEKAKKAMGALKDAQTRASSMRVFESPDETERIWGIREDGLGATAYTPLEGGHWPGWEDSAVPPERVGDYLRDLDRLCDEHGYDVSFYGHFGQGCIHCRINFDLKTADGIRKYRNFMYEAADLVVSYGGSLSGEHGDGQQRAELLPKMYGEELMQAFREFKEIWDPERKMNPGKVIDANRMTDDLRLGTDYNPREPETFFSYPEDHGSFAHATLRCVGAGKCRDIKSGTMCPSYMVTLEEKHTTRGRARILHEMLRGKVIKDGFRSREVFDALDLCLSCKGCKGDCPVDVDMATYKAEFLSKYYKRRLRPAYAYAMGLIMFHARIAQYVPRLANLVTHTPVIKDLIKRAGGLTTEREMPPFATQTFKDWFEERGPSNLGSPPVVLFPDTFNNYFHPETAKATVEVLEDAGYRIIVPQQHLCCGRPLFDYGMLDTAKDFFNHLVDGLRSYVREGIYIVGIEPSCVAALRDELPNMLPHDEDAKRLSQNTLTLGEFLTQEAEHYDPPNLDRKAIVHGHCHHKSIMGMDAEKKLLEELGLDFEILDSGCCGLAGSWGFEKEHYDLSMQIGERRLLPAVRNAERDTLIISDGFSCKTQIEHATDRRALHMAQVIKMAMDHGSSGSTGDYPELGYPDVVLDGHKPEIKAATVAGAAVVGGTLAWGLKKRRFG